MKFLLLLFLVGCSSIPCKPMTIPEINAKYSECWEKDSLTNTYVDKRTWDTICVECKARKK